MGPSDPPPSLVPPEAVEEAARQVRLMNERMRAVAAQIATDAAASNEHLRALTAGIVGMTEPFAGLMAEIRRGFAEQAARIAEIARAAQEGFRETLADFAEAERLGTFGWTVPMHRRFLTFAISFARRRTRRAPTPRSSGTTPTTSRSLADLRQHDLKCPVLATWKEWLEEALFAFDAGKYRVCVPSLVAIMDGVAHTYWRAKFYHSPTRKEFFEGELSKYEPGDLSHCMWLSIQAFVNSVFAPAFSPPDGFNRNWMMHARGVPAGTRIECIRVLQAIGTFADHAEEPGETPPQARA